MVDLRSRKPRERLPPIEALGIALSLFEELEELLRHRAARSDVSEHLWNIYDVFRNCGIDAMHLTPSGVKPTNVQFVINEPRFGFDNTIPYGYREVLDFLRTTHDVLVTANVLITEDVSCIEDAESRGEDPTWGLTKELDPVALVSDPTRSLSSERMEELAPSLSVFTDTLNVVATTSIIAPVMIPHEEISCDCGVVHHNPLDCVVGITGRKIVSGANLAVRGWDQPVLTQSDREALDTDDGTMLPSCDEAEAPTQTGSSTSPQLRVPKLISQTPVWDIPADTAELLDNYVEAFTEIGEEDGSGDPIIRYVARGILDSWCYLDSCLAEGGDRVEIRDTRLAADDHILVCGRIWLKAGFFYWLLANRS